MNVKVAASHPNGIRDVAFSRNIMYLFHTSSRIRIRIVFV